MSKSDMLYKAILFSVVFILISCLQLPTFAQTEKGIEYLNSMEYEKAEDSFRKVLKSDSGNIEASYYLGMSLFMQEKYKKALSVFEQVKATGKYSIPNKGQLEITLTRIYLELEKYPEALKSLEAAKKAKANPADIHVYQGAYYIEKNDSKRAMKELEKAIELDSNNAYAYYYAGYAYMRMGNPAEAVKMFNRFLE